MNFVHLHVHTEYSLLDGECRINALPAAAKEMDMPAVAITDHGALFGAVEFFKECKKVGIKPIIGCEMYVAPRGMEDKVHPQDSTPYHLVLLAKNGVGYRNLCKLLSDANIRGFYRKPRIDIAALEKHGEGLIALSGCMSGVLSKRILNDETTEAEQTAIKLKQIFGKDFYIELQRNGVEGQLKVNSVLYSLAKKLNIPVVATNDVHYIKKEDSEIQELLMAIATGNKLGDKSFSLPTEEFYLKSPEAMNALFYDIPEAVKNTVKIAEECNFEFDFKTFHLPSFDVPGGMNSEEYLKSLAEKGLEKRLPNEEKREEYFSRLRYELSVIHSMGFDDYFLVVWDFVNYARSRDIPVGPGRGSAVGSLCAFSLGITDVDPIKFGLLFERFLNPERLSMPDIDIDFCDERRGEVIDYVARKYGEDHMAQIITFGTLQARAAVRDVGRALGMDYAEVDAVAKMIPRFMGVSLSEAINSNPELKAASESDVTGKLLSYAKKLEGRPRNASTHATGVVITDKPITDYLPLSANDDVIVTQYVMTTVADLGLLKMDFLGLRFLTVLRDAESLAKRKNPSFDLEKIGFDDKKTFELLSQGKSLGLFQLESEGMRSLLCKLEPENLEDIVSVISIYRPGPAQFIDEFLKNRKDRDNISYKTPLLKDILSPTMGCMLYQEQVMQVCRVLAGYSYGRADLVRRAMAKKKKEEMAKERNTFVSGCLKNGISVEIASEIFDSMESFASYAFNKSHAAAYAVVAYRTAYLKAHYPQEYMCALLNSVMWDSAKVNEYITECNSLGFSVLPPDVNKSGSVFVPEGENLRFGLAAIKNIGIGFAEKLVEERTNNGIFGSFDDFLCRSSMFINSKSAESLVLCGACDNFGVFRSKMLCSVEKALQSLAGMKDEMRSGQISLFETAGSGYSPLKINYPNINEYPEKDKLAFEKQYTGVYFSGHPLLHYGIFAKSIKSVKIKDLYSGLKSGTIRDKAVVSLVGQLKELRKKATKTNKLMGFLTLEDLSGDTEIIVFPSAYEKFAYLFEEGNILAVSGEASLEEPYNGEGEDVLKIILKTCSLAKTDSELVQKNVYIKITPQNKDLLPEALDVLKKSRGKSKVFIYYEEEKKLTVSKDIFVYTSDGLISELGKIMGEKNVASK